MPLMLRGIANHSYPFRTEFRSVYEADAFSIGGVSPYFVAYRTARLVDKGSVHMSALTVANLKSLAWTVLRDYVPIPADRREAYLEESLGRSFARLAEQEPSGEFDLRDVCHSNFYTPLSGVLQVMIVTGRQVPVPLDLIAGAYVKVDADISKSSRIRSEQGDPVKDFYHHVLRQIGR